MSIVLRLLKYLTVGLLLGILVLPAWVMYSESGTRWALGQADRWVPGELDYERVAGTLGRQIQFQGLHWADPGGTVLQVDQLSVSLHWPALRTGRLVLTQLDAQGVQVLQGSGPAGAEPAVASSSNPIELPLELVVRDARIGDLCVAVEYCVKTVRLKSLLQKDARALLQLSADSRQGAANLLGQVDLNPPHDLNIRALVLPAKDAPQISALTSEPLRLNVSVVGNLQSLQARAQAALSNAPPFALAEIDLKDALGRLNWSAGIALLEVESSPSLVLPVSAPLKFQFNGTAQSVQGQGFMTVEQTRIDVTEVDLGIASMPRVQIQSLTLSVPEQHADGSFQGAFNIQDQTFDLSVAATATMITALAGDDLSTQLGYQAQGSLSGDLSQWRFTGQVQVDSGNERLAASADVVAEGDLEGLRLDTLNLRTGSGALSGSGELNWSSGLSGFVTLDANDFDPGYWLADWPGRLSFRSRVEISQPLDHNPNDWQLMIEVPYLDGSLRQHPVNGQISASLADNQALAKLELASGDSRVQLDGQWRDLLRTDGSDISLSPNSVINARVDLNSSSLEDFVPGMHGQLQGWTEVSGNPLRPRLRGDLKGHGLVWQDWSVETLALNASGEETQWSAALNASGLSLSDLQSETGGDAASLPASKVSDSGLGKLQDMDLSAQLEGDPASARFRAQASAASTTIALESQLIGPASDWAQSMAGELQAMTLSDPIAGDWELASPIGFQWSGSDANLEQFCLTPVRPSNQGQLCAGGDWAPDHALLQFSADQLPIPLLTQFVELELAQPIAVQGLLKANGQWRMQDQNGQLEVEIQGTDWVLAWGQGDNADQSRIDTFTASAQMQDQRLEAEFAAAMGQGSLGGGLNLPLEGDDQALAGHIVLTDFPARQLEAVWPRITDAGVLSGRLDADGTMRQPNFSGQLQLTQLKLDFPAQGVAPVVDDLTIEGAGDELRLALRVTSGSGELRGQGNVKLTESGPLGEISLKGENFEVLRTSAASIVGSPDVVASISPGQVHISGSVVLPGGQVDLSQVALGTTPSSDVVRSPSIAAVSSEAQQSAQLVSADLVLKIQPALALKAPGFSGDVSGELRMLKEADSDSQGYGELALSGTYQAYGQDLTLERGFLLYAGSALTNPSLDMLAVRNTGDVSAGLAISGTIRQPRAKLWSRPLMADNVTLSYLLYGQAPSDQGQVSGDALAGAAQALALAQGNALAAPVAGALGVDELRVEPNGDLAQATLLVGKYLTPGLYVAYGVGLIDPINVVRLRYDVSTSLRLEVESGTEIRSSLRYRIERD